jgi:tetratricopeptide (TPR) repeat protein
MSIFSKLFGTQTVQPTVAAPPIDVKTALEACEQKQQEKDFAGLITLVAPLVTNPRVPPDDKAKAYILRGDARVKSKDFEGAIADCTQAITLATNPDRKAEALWLRAECKRAAKDGNWRAGMDDLSEILRLPGVGVEQRARALFWRALAMHYTGNFKGACADHTAIIGLSGASAEWRAKALLARAESRIELFDEAGELEDYNTALKMPDLPAAERGRALYRRGYFHQWVSRNNAAAAADYTDALSVQGLSEELRRAAIDSLESLGVDYSAESKIVDELKTQLRAARSRPT